MENNFPSKTDPQLSALLQSWKVEPHGDPRLASRVWSRIAPEKTPAKKRWFDHLVLLFARPLVAFSTVALFAALGAALAFTQNSRQEQAQFERLVREYVRSIDPVQMTALHVNTSSLHDHP